MPAPVQAGLLDATGTTVFFSSADASILPGAADTNGAYDVFAVDLLSRLDRDGDPSTIAGRSPWGSTTPAPRRGRADRRSRRRWPDQPAGAGRRLAPARHVARGSSPRAPTTPSSRRASASSTRAPRRRRRSCASTATAAPRRRRSTSTCPPVAERTVFVDDVAPPSPRSRRSSSRTAPLVTERTMSWDATGYGAHAERASAAPVDDVVPRRRLHRRLLALLPAAEPRRHGGDRDGPLPAAGAAGADRADLHAAAALAHDAAGRTAGARARRDRRVGGDHRRRSRSSSSARCIDRVEGQPFAAGHASAGVTARGHELVPRRGRDRRRSSICSSCSPTRTRRPPTSRSATCSPTAWCSPSPTRVAGDSRRTIYVDGEDFPDSAWRSPTSTVSCAITSTNDVPIVVERSMWFPGPEVTPGSGPRPTTSPGSTVDRPTRWVLADGEAGGARAMQTYVLIANTSSTAGQARLTVLPELATTPIAPSSLSPFPPSC